MIPLSREQKEERKEMRMRKGMCLNLAVQMITSEIKAGQREPKQDKELIPEIIDLAEELYQTLERRKYWGD